MFLIHTHFTNIQQLINFLACHYYFTFGGKLSNLSLLFVDLPSILTWQLQFPQHRAGRALTSDWNNFTMLIYDSFFHSCFGQKSLTEELFHRHVITKYFKNQSEVSVLPSECASLHSNGQWSSDLYLSATPVQHCD